MHAASIARFWASFAGLQGPLNDLILAERQLTPIRSLARPPTATIIPPFHVSGISQLALRPAWCAHQAGQTPPIAAAND